MKHIWNRWLGSVVAIVEIITGSERYDIEGIADEYMMLKLIDVLQSGCATIIRNVWMEENVKKIFRAKHTLVTVHQTLQAIIVTLVSSWTGKFWQYIWKSFKLIVETSHRCINHYTIQPSDQLTGLCQPDLTSLFPGSVIAEQHKTQCHCDIRSRLRKAIWVSTCLINIWKCHCISIKTEVCLLSTFSVAGGNICLWKMVNEQGRWRSHSSIWNAMPLTTLECHGHIGEQRNWCYKWQRLTAVFWSR